MSERTFKITKTLIETTVTEVILTEAEARDMFEEEDVPWDDPDASHAGYMDDALSSTEFGDTVPEALAERIAATGVSVDEDETWKVEEL